MSDRCPGCRRTLHTRTAVPALVVSTLGGVALEPVCPSCAKEALPLVRPSASAEMAGVLGPFAAYLDNLARVYDKDGEEGRAEGLHQAAAILLSGKVPHIEPRRGAAIPAVEENTPPPILPKVAMTPPRQATLTGVGANGQALQRKALLVPPQAPRAERAEEDEEDEEDDAADGGSGDADERLISVLSQEPSGRLPRTTLAVRAGYSAGSGAYAKALTRLRASGDVVDDHRELRLSPEGRARALRAGRVLVPGGHVGAGTWAEKVGGQAGLLLQILVTAFPCSVSRAELAERSGYQASSGSFAKALTKLRRKKLCEKRELRATEALMRQPGAGL